jgi:hypothetical protein
MADLTAALKRFAVQVILSVHPPLPVKVELMDLSLVPFFEMTVVGPSEEGIWQFSDERYLPGTTVKRGPYTVRFTPKGEKSFTKEFAESL